MEIKQRPKILVVDDDPQITKVLRASLVAEGYDVRTANEGESALDLFQVWRPHIVLTDLVMPNMDGMELCRRLRTCSKVPILVLSVTQEERVKVEALDAGADDYVVKPFGMDELIARVRAGLRRAQDDPAAETDVVAVGDFWLDVESRRALLRDTELRLTPKEFDLLRYFARNPGKVLTHRRILEDVWGPGYVDQGESLRVYVGQIRKKIEADPSRPRYLVTEPWVGYRFDAGLGPDKQSS